MGNRTDDFNRTDSTTSLGTPSDGGSAWVASSGTWGISSNQGYCPTPSGDSAAVLESSLSNVAVQVTNATHNANDGIIVRWVDDSNYLLVIFTDSQVLFYQKVAGTFVSTNTVSGGTASGDVIKVTVDSANLLTAYINDVSKGSVTDSNHNTATSHGLRTLVNSARFDTFSITDLTAGVTTEYVGPIYEHGLGAMVGRRYV